MGIDVASFAHENKVPLNSQFNENINWTNYNLILIGNKGSGPSTEEWSQKILCSSKIKEENICAIASVPKWMLKTSYSKIIIKI